MTLPLKAASGPIRKATLERDPRIERRQLLQAAPSHFEVPAEIALPGESPEWLEARGSVRALAHQAARLREAGVKFVAFAGDADEPIPGGRADRLGCRIREKSGQHLARGQ